MPRTLSQAIKNVLSHNWGETHDVCVITFPASGEQDEIILYCASVDGLEIDSQEYSNILRGISQIKFSIGANADQCTLTIENVSKNIGLTISDTSRTLDGSRVEVKRAYRIADGTLEAITLFNGVVQGVSIDENAATLTVVSDFTHSNAKVASRQCTQRCIWTFKGPECGWRSGGTGNPVDQAGDPDDCNLIFNSPGGCSGHANQHRFGGVPPLIGNQTTTPIIGVSGSPIGGGGSGGGLGGDGGYEDYNASLRRKVFDRDYDVGRLTDTEIN